MRDSSLTIVYVDVDGVLNVGIREPGSCPLLLVKDNCDFAVNAKDDIQKFDEDGQSVERLLAVMSSNPHLLDGDTYSRLICDSEDHISGVLVERLAEILRSVRGRRSVVLSSTWRHPRFAQKVARLEQRLSQLLGEDFVFDARTDWAHEASASQRLWGLGKHLTRTCCRLERVEEVKVVVLDDFNMTPLNGWACRGQAMWSPADIESLLRSCGRRSAPGLRVDVKMVHCYAELVSASGLQVQVGSGLSTAAVCEVLNFLAPSTARPQTVSFADFASLMPAIAPVLMGKGCGENPCDVGGIARKQKCVIAL
mmetsp:Transcript_23664/g.67957  ORF Transcript_23664/g.67957 Transcript_23664/m.67957 type:complete len:310 (-) Transcript_23664:49-978(-)|eukprot:CAMPEP_0176054358 /NCGR_PEP_ID=MMETSP0120_2-20121206/27045_1 /TAXON_ID=160619 /ORGANISM="Kryptoperidinium foliaceum, Strain CCMP 1326" /LENGTH=309 /DNA_ID=CAMNT_0017387823 /DNA_START=86 /DNA_END=1015 /DNA_ORIENTATION=+